MIGNTIKNLMKRRDSMIVLSVLWGFGLACLFQKVCKGRDCIVYRAPARDFIDKNIFRFDGKCYSYIPRLVKCNGNEILHE